MNSGEECNEKVAAGGVVLDRKTRPDSTCRRVLLVHRPRYDDWSFPKGGVLPGERLEEAALREVKEETGLVCRIIRELTTTRYTDRTKRGALRAKVVHYFLMEPEGGQLAIQGDEVDRVEWFDTSAASRILSYQTDRTTLRLVLEGNGEAKDE